MRLVVVDRVISGTIVLNDDLACRICLTGSNRDMYRIIARLHAIAKENKIRVTFDNRIEATESCFDLFSERLNMNPVLDLYNVVLEVKFNGFILYLY